MNQKYIRCCKKCGNKLNHKYDCEFCKIPLAEFKTYLNPEYNPNITRPLYKIKHVDQK